MKIADSILVDAPVERVFDVVKERHVEVWAQTNYDLYHLGQLVVLRRCLGAWED